ncbi:BON domain [Paraburkholderia caribensis MBA4]|uniref:BON domain n=1 Tax=Paraburkholderia caribensis MBA4 TaxID=1323664 RepID=A0A0P0RI72_9BURK|nr:BON domain-containing protein [Paraburkholderia caribensis]ALL68473.1 BON domain [Paraburkholderia caribensis MBA4]
MTVQKVWAVIGAAIFLGTTLTAHAQPASSSAGAATTASSNTAMTKKQIHKQNRALERSVRNALRKVKGLDVATITVIAKGPAVTITGEVREQTQIDGAGAAASKVAGVGSVDNRLTIATPGH